MADRVGPAAAEDLRTEHFGLLRGAPESSVSLAAARQGANASANASLSSTPRRSPVGRRQTSARSRCLIASRSASRVISMRMCDRLSLAFSIGPPTTSSPTSAEASEFRASSPSSCGNGTSSRCMRPSIGWSLALSQPSVSVTIARSLGCACGQRLTRSFRSAGALTNASRVRSGSPPNRR